MVLTLLKALRRRPSSRLVPMSDDDRRLWDELRRRRDDRHQPEAQR